MSESVPFNDWVPTQYNEFAAEREEPFWDLVRLIRRVAAPVVVDLGCGDGRLTASLSRTLEASSTVGIDNSRAMIKDASAHQSSSVVFELGDIGSWQRVNSTDIVFSNAAMHWVPHHADVLARWASSLRPGGQLAIQIPFNHEHPAHELASSLAGELMAHPPRDVVAANVLAPEQYAEILDELGFEHQSVRMQVYAHHLSSSSDVVDWVKGSTLNRFKEPMGAQLWEEFIDQYRQRLVAQLGMQTPYLYLFRRILIWAS